jgi:hypothetical protein
MGAAVTVEGAHKNPKVLMPEHERLRHFLSTFGMNRNAINEVWVGPTIVMIGLVGDAENYYRLAQEHGTTEMIHRFDADPDSVRKAAKWIAGRTVTLKAPSPHRALGTRSGESGTDTRGTGGRSNVHHARPFRYISRVDD